MSDEDTEYDKILGQYRGVLRGLLFPLRLYGQGHYCDCVMEELVSLAVQMHLKLSGIDIPYEVEIPHW